VPSGVAGILMLWRRRDQITQPALIGLLALLTLYLGSILSATGIGNLSRRTNGLIQLTYSVIIGYGLFLTVTQATRRQLAALFLGFALVIVAGCLLENYTPLKAVSDSARQIIYNRGVYENDIRDLLLYKRVRPKFFASEPASVTFCYAFFVFIWFVVSPWRWKLPLYLGLMGIGMFAMPGPTLILMLLMAVPYMLFIASRRNGRLDYVQLIKFSCLAILLGVAALIVGWNQFAARIQEINHGNDASFFYRVLGPAIAGRHLLAHYPIAGAGLTGEPFVEAEVINLYLRSPAYSEAWVIVSPASELLINFFWLHWIYLGLVWGLIITAAWSVWLRKLGVPSIAFCWVVWAIMGQAAGAYVGPTCWAVLFLAGGASLLNQREAAASAPKASQVDWFSLPARLARRYAYRGRPMSAEELRRSGVAIFDRRS
jgi:hypothetical protein